MMQHNIRLSHRDRSGKTIYDCLVNKPDMYSYILLKTIAAVTIVFRNAVIKTKTRSHALMYNRFLKLFRQPLGTGHKPQTNDDPQKIFCVKNTSW